MDKPTHHRRLPFKVNGDVSLKLFGFVFYSGSSALNDGMVVVICVCDLCFGTFPQITVDFPENSVQMLVRAAFHVLTSYALRVSVVTAHR